MVGGFEYDVFISYAHADDNDGWVTTLVDVIDEDFRAFASDFRIFFDRREIHTRQQWEERIAAGLRTSRVLLICVSPNYLRSQFCHLEWDEFHRHSARRIGGADSVTGAFFVPVGSIKVDDDAAAASWWSDVSKVQLEDLAPWFGSGVQALQERLVRDRVATLSGSVADSVRQARLAKASPGNLLRHNPGFVGRTRELRQLRDLLAGTGCVGVVASVHGLGGIGKTELATTYAHAYAHMYQGGTWVVGAEGKTDLLETLSLLAAPDIGLDMPVSDEDRRDPQRIGRMVLRRLEQLTAAAHEHDPETAACLVLLDNVSEASLLSASELAHLPSAPWLHVVMTTRLGESDVFAGGARSQVGMVEVDRLTDEDAYELLRLHQPARDADKRVHDFADDEQRSAARGLVGELDGYTLAVEQAAVYLGADESRTPSGLLARLREHGVIGLDRVSSGLGDQVRHEAKMVGTIVDATIAGLPEPARRALAFASYLPPDLIVWEWLRELSAGDVDDAAVIVDDPWSDVDPRAGAEPWVGIRRMLEGRNLITSGDEPGVARMHRVIHRHVSEVAVGLYPDARDGVDQLLTVMARRMTGEQVPDGVELRRVAEATVFRLGVAMIDRGYGDSPGLGSMVEGALWFCQPVMDRLDLEVAQRLSVAVSRLLEARLPPNGISDDRDHDRLFAVSLDRVGDVAVRRGEWDVAAEVFGRGLEIAEGLLASDPGRPEYRRDVAVSGYNLADLCERTDPQRAERYWHIAYVHLARMDELGVLADSDRQFLDLARSKLNGPETS